MRLPTSARTRGAAVTRRVLAMVLFALCVVASPRAALATHYVVDPGGSGDFTTIQAGLDAQFANFRDTVLVLPGAYAESLFLPKAYAPSASTQVRYVVATSGAALTSVRTVVPPVETTWSDLASYKLRGFTLTEDLALVNHAWNRAQFSACVFQGRVYSNPHDLENYPNFSDCDFYGRTQLYKLVLTFERLRFHGAPLVATHSTSGTFRMRRCTFEGPADTLFTLLYANYDYAAFDTCTFADAQHGILYGGLVASNEIPITACTFRDLTGFAVSTTDTSSGPSPAQGGRVRVSDSRFERCGTAVRWVRSWRPTETTLRGATLVRDTILASTGDAVVLGPQLGGGLDHCIVDGSAGHGVVFGQSWPAAIELSPSSVSILASTFTNNGGDGVCLRDSVPVAWTHYPYPTTGYAGPVVTGSVFAGNGGAGLRLETHRWNVADCIAYGNGGDGFALTNTSPAFAARTVGNTSALNQGDGFRFATYGGVLDTLHVVQHDLSASNAGAGFRPGAPGVGSLAFNDAYSNYAGQYIGPAAPLDSNLVVDPKFCALGSGVSGLGLEAGSPCAPSGVYNQIGARGVECPATTGVTPAAPALAFAVRPSVARGSVEFAAPAGGEGRVAVYDLAGRVVWRAALGGARAHVRWNGEGERGRVRAGLYWVRFTRGAESATQRLVWLE